MTDTRTTAIEFAHANRPRFLNELMDFASIPSISTDPEAKMDIQKAAEWVAARLTNLNAHNVQILRTDGHPVVYAEMLSAGPDAPTILVYGHYDVQPADPLELWQTGPFTPDVRGDNIFARGITDMKGQVMAVLNAVESVLHAGALPVNLKFMIEGEEEIGSPSLEVFMENHKDLLACDFALNPDTGILDPDIPTITYALRGLAYFELRVFGPDHDLHSGVFGGAVLNPAQALCELIAGMHDANGRIMLPGFYDKVRALKEDERNELARLPINDDFFLRTTGAPGLWGEAGYTSVERVGSRPTLEVNGLLSGFTGEGAKTVLPAWAMAKISTRLVPDQTPDVVYRQMQEYLTTNAPSAVRWTLKEMHGGVPSISDRNSVGNQALTRAMESVWGKRPVYKREGGSVPVVTQFQRILGVESVNTGFALPDDNMHSPNEKMHLPTWHRGIDTFIHFFYNLAE